MTSTPSKPVRCRAVAAFALLLFFLGVSARAQDRNFSLQGTALRLQDLSSEAEVFFQSMRFNRASNVWNVEVTVRNKGTRELNGPIVLSIESASGTPGPIAPDGIGDGSPGKPFYDLTALGQNGLLAPGQTSRPRTLTLGFNGSAPVLTTKVFGSRPVFSSLVLARAINDAGVALGDVVVQRAGSPDTNLITTEPRSGLVTLPGTNATWKFSKTNHLSSWRTFDAGTNNVGLAPSPRLTPRSTNTVVIGVASGGAVVDPSGVLVSYEPGSFNSEASVTLTALGGQGLPGLLPMGWSPLQAFWLDGPPTQARPALASIKPWGPVATNETAIVVRWSDELVGWVALQPVMGNGANPLPFPVDRPGVYALVIGDTVPVRPPVPAAGSVLAGVDTNALAPGLWSASGRMNPPSRAASRNPDLVTAQAELLFTNASGPLPSGFQFFCDITEVYQLRNGSRRLLPGRDGFFIAYQRGPLSSPGMLQASVPIRPSLLLAGDELSEAVLRVDVLTPDEFRGGVLATNGGQIAEGDLRVVAGIGELSRDQAALIRSVDATNFTELASEGFSLVGGFELGVGALGDGRRLALQGNVPLTNGLVVLARVLNEKGDYGLEPLERFSTDAAGKLASLEPAGQDRLPGLDGSGQFVLVGVQLPQVLLSGIARNVASQPAEGLSVRSAGTPWLTFSRLNGLFRLLSPAGPSSLQLRSLATSDDGEASLTLTNGVPATGLDVALSGRGPRVVSIQPTNTATRVSRVASISVTFSRAMNPATLATGIGLFGTGGQAVPAAVSLNLAGTVATLQPASQLAASALHQVVLSTNLVDLQGRFIEGPLAFSFTTEAVAANRSLAALTIYEPGTDGLVPFFGTPGTAEPESPVILLNETSGQTSTVLSKPDGSFTNRIEGSQDDFISAVIVNRNGTSITVPASRQVFRDGRVGLFSGGGTVESANEFGTMQFIAEPGSIDGKTIFRFEGLTATQLLQELGTNQPEGGAKVLSGFRLQREGPAQLQSADISAPIDVNQLGLQPGESPTNRAFVLCRNLEVDGVKLFEVVDKLEFEDGKLVSHSPPFLGALGDPALNTFTMIMMGAFQLKHVVVGRVVAAPAGAGEVTEEAIKSLVTANGTPLSYVPGSVVMIDNGPNMSLGLRAGAITARANTLGFYSALVPYNTFNPEAILLRAYHPAFSGIRAVRVFTPEGIRAGPVVGSAMNLVFSLPPGATNDTRPPKIQPLAPALVMPVKTNVTIAFRVTDDAGLPTISSVKVIEDESFVVGSTNKIVATNYTATLGGANVEGATQQRYDVDFKVDIGSTITMEVVAQDPAGNVVSNSFRFFFGTGPGTVGASIPKGDPADELPPTVVSSFPADYTMIGRDAGSDLVFEFSEPIDPELATNADVVAVSPPGTVVSPVLSANQRQLRLRIGGLQPGKDYSVVLQSTKIRDLSGNYLAASRTLPFKTPPDLSATLQESGPGAGTVSIGSFSFSIARINGEGELQSHSIGTTDTALLAGRLRLPFYPRAVVAIPYYSFSTGTNGARKNEPISTNRQLVAVAGGALGSDNPGQILWVVDVSNPTNMVRISSEVANPDPAASFTHMKWVPPYLFIGELNPEGGLIYQINLQAFILGGQRIAPPIPVPGLDSNGDGDFVDEGDELPLPQRLTFWGNESVITLSDKRSFDDFDVRQGTLAVVMGPKVGKPGRFQLVLNGGSFVGDGSTAAGGLEYMDPSLSPRRVALDLDLPIETALGTKIIPAALVAIGPDLEVIDLSNPETPVKLQTIRLPTIEGIAPGRPFTITRSGPDEYAVGTVDGIYYLRRSLLWHPDNDTDKPPAVTRRLSGSLAGRVVVATDLTFAGSSGGTVFMKVRDPYFRLVSAQGYAVTNIGSIVEKGVDEVRLFKSRWSEPRILTPAWRCDCPPGIPPALGTSNLPPHESAHYYAVLRAPGRPTNAIYVTVESLDLGGQLARPAGKDRPPVFVGSSDGTIGVDQMQPAVEPLKARRLSDDPFSDDFNTFVTDPIVLVREPLTADEKTLVKDDKRNRTVLWAGDNLRLSLDDENEPQPFAPFIGVIEGSRFKPVVQRVYKAFRAEMADSPNRSFPSAAPRFMGVDLQSGEARQVYPDILVEGREQALNLTRVYESRSRYVGPFGRGWDFSLNVRLQEVVDDLALDFRVPNCPPGAGTNGVAGLGGDVMFYDGAGNAFRFPLISEANGNATNFNLYAKDPAIDEVLGSGGTNKIARFYESPNGIFSVLYKFKDGTWWMIHPTGGQMFFDSEGRITKSKGRSRDSVITFKYREDGKLDRVTGDRGIYLEFGYYYPPPAVINSGGPIDKPSDQAKTWGRICKVRAQSTLNNESEVEYEYDDVGNLWKTKPKFGAEIVHSYDTATPDLLLKVGRGDGSEEPGVSIVYDPKGLVSTLTVDGQVTSFAGAKETGADRARLPSETVSFTRNGQVVNFVVDDKGRPTKFANRDFKADDSGLPTEVADSTDAARIVYDGTNTNHRFRGNVIRTERGPVGGTMVVTKMVYEKNLLNALKSSTDANGVVTDYEFSSTDVKTKTGGVVTRTDRINRYNQSEGVDLQEGQSLFTTTMAFGSGSDNGLVITETPTGSAANTYKRNTKGQIFQSGAGDRTQTIDFNDDGQPKKISGTDLPTVEFTYENGLPKTRTISSGTQSIKTTTTYGDSSHKAKVSQLDFEETGLGILTTTYDYDAQGRLTTMTVGGKATTYGFDGVQVISETGPGLKKTSEFFSEGRLKKMTENGVEASFTYDNLGRLETSIQQGTTTTMTYDDATDARPRLKTKEITGTGGSSLMKEEFTYDDAGRIDTITGMGGRVRKLRYFPDGKLREAEVDGTVLQTFTRDQGGRTTKTRLNDIEIEYSNFDSSSDVAKTEKVTMLKSSKVITRELTLDNRARLKEVDVLGEISKFEYDDFGNLKKLTDPDGIERSFTYTPSGKLLSATFSDGTKIDYQYNAEHLLTAISNATAGAISYAFDADNLVKELKFPDGDKTTYNSRDSTTFEPATIGRGDGEITQTLGYNSTTKRLETTTADGETITIEVDGLGRRTNVKRGSSTVTYLYNAYGEPVGETTSAGTWRVSLDSRNRLESESYPSGMTVTYGSDTYGLPTTGGGLGIGSMTFLGAGIWSEIRYTGGLVVKRNYASDLDLEDIEYGSMAGPQFTASAGYRYGLTAGARVLSEELIHESGRSHVYDRHAAEDALRLKDIGFSTESNTVASGVAKLTGLSYTNGEVRAPAQGTLGGDLRGYFPNLSFSGQRVVSADGFAVQYNKRGSVTNAPLYVRLPGQFTPTIIPARLDYDGFGMLKRVVRSDGVTVAYTRDGLSRIIEREVTGSASLCEPGRWRYVWKGNQLIEEHVDSGGFKLVRRYGYLGGTLVSVERAGTPGGALTRFAPMVNIVDSVGGYLNLDGSLAEYIRFTAWGYPVFPEGRGSAIGSTLLFHGALFDVETGLYQMGQRNLHPILGRFLQRDSALFKESLAFYSGFNGDPASRKDADGTFTGPAEAKELYDRVMAVKSAADDAKEAAGELVPFLNLVRGHGEQPEDPIAGGLDAAIKTSDFLLKVATLGKTAAGDDEIDLKKAQAVLQAFTTTKDAYEKFIKPGADLIATGLKLRDYRVASWVSDPRNSAWFGNIHTLGARFSVFDLDFEALKKGASATAKSHDQETMSHEFLGKLQDQRTQFYDARKKFALEVVTGLHGLAAQYYEKNYGKREEKAFLVGGGIMDATGKFLEFGSKFQEAKDLGEALGKITGRSATLMQGYEVASSAAGRAAVVAAFDLGFSVGKLAIMAASDPIVAKAYKEQVQLFEEQGGWMTVGAGVLATFGMDEAAMAIQSFHDGGGFSLQPFADAFMKQRAYHQERTEFYLNGISAP